MYGIDCDDAIMQGISLTRNLDSSQRADMRAYMSLGTQDRQHTHTANVSDPDWSRIRIGFVFRGLLDPDSEAGSGSRGLKKGQTC